MYKNVEEVAEFMKSFVNLVTITSAVVPMTMAMSLSTELRQVPYSRKTRRELQTRMKSHAKEALQILQAINSEDDDDNEDD